MEEYKNYFDKYSEKLIDIKTTQDIKLTVIEFYSEDRSQKITIMADGDTPTWLTIDRLYRNQTIALYEGHCHGVDHLVRILNDIIVPVYAGFNYLKELNNF